MTNNRIPVLALVGGFAAMVVAASGVQPASAAVNKTTSRSNTQHNVTAQYDPGTGHAAGNRQHKPITTGATTGKRRHAPVHIHRTVDSATPL
jgi:hypothetical protein